MIHRLESEIHAIPTDIEKKSSLREAMLHSLIKQSNNVSVDSDGYDYEEGFDESELKSSKLLDLTTDENTKYF